MCTDALNRTKEDTFGIVYWKKCAHHSRDSLTFFVMCLQIFSKIANKQLKDNHTNYRQTIDENLSK